MVVIFITGQPGTGKSSLVQEIIRELGVKAGGILTPEIRKDGRTGFKIINLASKKTGILAALGVEGPKVGRYGVNIKHIGEIGVPAIEMAIKDPDTKLIVIDELGRMEMMCEQFKKVVERVMGSGKNCLIVLHRVYVSKYASRGLLFNLTKENRQQVKEKILQIFKS